MNTGTDPRPLPDRGWGADRESWDRGYLPGATISPDPFLREYTRLSAEARRVLPWREIAYGPGDHERAHFFPAAAPGAPLLVFVHGGYWQELGPAESAFAARDVVAAGAAFAALGYGLAPRHRLDEIGTQVRRGVARLCRDAEALGVDGRRVVLAGHSAGAQLVAMCLRSRPEATRIRAAVLISGLYELEPLLRTSIGPAIRLDPDEAARNSPARALRAGMPPLLAVRGGDEPVGFADQQDLLVAAARAAGAGITEVVVPGRNHFDLPLGLGDPSDPLGREVLARLAAPASPTRTAGTPGTKGTAA
ncbi:esterase [Sphaerisporangium siamense]|uniref:Arylformamidase n=1 Tax=Sphaerisporangium siamense TaxID=795645 RepID=A0A7W7GB12_9ACTN|nr:alpha/beta hydrolase [Sphaerisporangium siamense]MBB4700541.1 arylformamidase [Sphaerisporangium siamense]GII88929.1 esterase [Sphaerisporangium siamense]